MSPDITDTSNKKRAWEPAIIYLASHSIVDNMTAFFTSKTRAERYVDNKRRDCDGSVDHAGWSIAEITEGIPFNLNRSNLSEFKQTGKS